MSGVAGMPSGPGVEAPARRPPPAPRWGPLVRSLASLAVFVAAGPLLGAVFMAGVLVLVLLVAGVAEQIATGSGAASLAWIFSAAVDFLSEPTGRMLLLGTIVVGGGVPAALAGLAIVLAGFRRKPPGWRFAMLAGGAAACATLIGVGRVGTDVLHALYLLSAMVASLACWRLTRGIAPRPRQDALGPGGGSLLEAGATAARPRPPEER